MSGWIGVDLDGTLAVYGKWQGPNHIGEPIPAMVERVKRWIAEGRQIKIFTARVSHDSSPERMNEASASRVAIIDWCRIHLGVEMIEITNEKDYGMIELWDDRCVQVEMNTGRAVERSTRGLE